MVDVMSIAKVVLVMLCAVVGSAVSGVWAQESSVESGEVKDFRFPRPGESVTSSPVSLEPVSAGENPGNTPESNQRKELQPVPSSTPIIDSKGAAVGRTDSLGQAVGDGGRVMGKVDSLGRVIQPGTGAIRGGVPGGQMGGSSLK